MQFVDDGRSHSESLPCPCRNSTRSCTKCSEAPFRYFCLCQTSGIIKLLSFSWQRSLKTKKRRGKKVEGISASSGDAFQPAWTALHPPWVLQHIPLFPRTRHFLLFSPAVPCKVCFTSSAMSSALHSPCLPALKFPQI